MRKKFISLLLCLVTVCSLALTGCGDSSSGDDSSNEEASARTAVTLNMWLISEKEVSAETEALVEEAFNELTQSKYTTKVDFVFMTEDEYYETLDASLAAAAEYDANNFGSIVLPGMSEETTEVVETTAEMIVNELGQRLLKYPEVEEHQIDIVFLSGRDRMETYITNMYLSALDTNLNATSKVLKDYIYPSLMEQIKFDKITYAIPNNHLIGEYTYLLVNKEMAEKYYIDVDKLTSFGACAELIEEIGTNETDIAPVLAYSDPVGIKYWLDGDNMSLIASKIPAGATAGTFTPMTSLFDIPEFTDHMLLMQKCEDNGWFAADAATQDFGVAIMTGGYDVYAKYGDKYDVKVLSYPTLTEEDAYSAMFAVTSYTADLNRAMEIITFINTNVEAKNILQYGVEGVHYEIDEDEGTFTILNDDYQMNNLYTGNMFLSYNTADVPADIWENAKIANRESTISPYIGLGSDWGNISATFLAALNEISADYLDRMNACANAEELEAFFATAKEELSNNLRFTAAFSVEEDSNSPFAVYTRWHERVWPAA